MEQIQKQIFNDLKVNYQKSTINKKELAQELGISVSTIDYYLAKGVNLPNYRKMSGNGNGGRVSFPLHEVGVP